MTEHSCAGEISAPSVPFKVALLARSTFSVVELRLAELIRSDSRFCLAAVLELEPGTASETPVRKANGSVAGVLISLLLATERRFLRDKEGVSPQEATGWPEAEQIRIKCPADLDNDLSGRAQERVQALELDVIVDFEGTAVPGWLANAARHGIWSAVLRGAWPREAGAAGSDLLAARGTTAVTLLQRGREMASPRVIAKAVYPARMTCTSTVEAARRKATELIWRELKKVQRTGTITFAHPDKAGDAAVSPGVRDLVGYISHLGNSAFNAVRTRAAMNFGVPRDRWSIFVGSGRYDGADWSRATEARPPAGEYWADPFLFRKQGDPTVHVFFERFEYGEGRGRISAGSISETGIVFLGDALRTGYHLSYPFVFEHEGDIWMIPETHETRRLELWRCVDFPLKWELAKTLLEGKSLADSTLCEHDGHWWLFTNEAGSDPDDHNSELHIYRLDTPMMNEIVPHASNPVVIDATRARNGGRIHRVNGSLLRPAQNNAFRYGYGLGVHRIRKLTLDSYDEEPVLSIRPDFRPGISCCHHLDSNGDIFVFDARLRSG